MLCVRRRRMDLQDVILGTAVLPLARVREGLTSISLHCAEVTFPPPTLSLARSR